MNSSRISRSRSDSPGKPTTKEVRRAIPGTAARTFSRVLRKMSAPAPRFMVLRSGGVGGEEGEPAEAFDAGERVEQEGEAVFDAKVFTVAGGVLADEGDLLDA